jgi:hypothetical protein
MRENDVPPEDAALLLDNLPGTFDELEAIRTACRCPAGWSGEFKWAAPIAAHQRGRGKGNLYWGAGTKDGMKCEKLEDGHRGASPVAPTLATWR